MKRKKAKLLKKTPWKKTFKAPRTKKISKSALWALYGLNRPPKPRYEGLKGIYWYVVSLYVRIRDLNTWGRCVACNKEIFSISDIQAGHFIAAGTGGFALLFDLRNINGECGYCNGFDQNHLIGYERNLDARYGKGFAAQLKEEYYESRKMGHLTKNWSNKEYDQKIRYLQGEIENL